MDTKSVEQKLRDKVKVIHDRTLYHPEDALPAALDELAAQERDSLTTTLKTASRVRAIPRIRKISDLPKLLRTP